MKKLSKKRKFFLDRRSVKLQTRKMSKCRERPESNIGLSNKKKKLRLETMTLATRLDFDDSIERTLKNFSKLREHLKHPNIGYINFNSLEFISASAALVLASEFDRSLLRGKKWNATRFDEWNKQPQYQLEDMGFFKLLNVDHNLLPPREAHEIEEHFLSFIRDSGTQPRRAEELREKIEKLMNSENNIKGLWPYVEISEAMSNCFNHAYANPDQNKYWWISAAFNKKQNTMTIIIFDHGVGIPVTVRKNWKADTGFIQQQVSKSDSNLIDWAVKNGNTGTDNPRRGKGLDDIRKYIDKLQAKSYLKIVSGKGLYYYYKDSKISAPKKELKNFKTAINGTLLEWKVWL